VEETFQIIVDRASTAIMILDTDLVINYANKTSIEFLEKYQREIRKVYPEFDLKVLVGTSLDSIQKIPHEILSKLKDPKRSQIADFIDVGNEKMHVTIYPIISSDGTDHGSAIEWWYATDYLSGIEHEKKTKELINVIDDLTFQSNILSINAAVEAAHAGEKGKSFAIIAAEMRDLSQRSRVATTEIKKNISRK